MAVAHPAISLVDPRIQRPHLPADASIEVSQA